MIILDTNVISEPMKPESDPRVAAWFDRQESSTLYLTAIGLAELFFGIAQIEEGRRKQGLMKSLEITRKRISGTVLSFDEPAAIAYSELMARTKAKGFEVSQPDGQIAAIAKAHGFAVATRDVTPFRAAGVAVINPWKTSRALDVGHARGSFAQHATDHHGALIHTGKGEASFLEQVGWDDCNETNAHVEGAEHLAGVKLAQVL